MRHHISIALVALLSAGLAAHFAQAQATAPTKASDTTTPAQGESDADLAAIRAESQAFVAAFNKHDAQAVAAFWTPEGEYIDEAGHRLAGRSEIEKAYTDFFAANPKAQMRIVMHSLRRLGPNLAIEDGSAAVDPSPKGVPGVALYTAVQTKVDGKWRMASVRDTWIETPAAVRSAADLEWLVGTWTGEEHGIRTESVIQWIVDGRFLRAPVYNDQCRWHEAFGCAVDRLEPAGRACPVLGVQPRWRVCPRLVDTYGQRLGRRDAWHHRRRDSDGRGQRAQETG